MFLVKAKQGWWKGKHSNPIDAFVAIKSPHDNIGMVNRVGK